MPTDSEAGARCSPAVPQDQATFSRTPVVAHSRCAESTRRVSDWPRGGPRSSTPWDGAFSSVGEGWRVFQRHDTGLKRADLTPLSSWNGDAHSRHHATVQLKQEGSDRATEKATGARKLAIATSLRSWEGPLVLLQCKRSMARYLRRTCTIVPHTSGCT